MSKRKHFQQKKVEFVSSKPPWGAIIASIILISLLLFLAFNDIVTIQGVIIDRKSLGPEKKEIAKNIATKQPTPAETSIAQIEAGAVTEKNKVSQLDDDSKVIDAMLQDKPLSEISPEIGRRQIGLQALIKRINAMTIVVQDQKSALISQVEAELGSLQTIQRKIPTDFSAEEQAKNKKTVNDSYSVYIVFMVKMNEIIHVDKLVNAANSVKIISDQMQVFINQEKQKGKEVTKVQNAINDRDAKISQTVTLIQNAVTVINQITPQGYPDNISSLKQARDMLKTARENIQSASANTAFLLTLLKETNK